MLQLPRLRVLKFPATIELPKTMPNVGHKKIPFLYNYTKQLLKFLFIICIIIIFIICRRLQIAICCFFSH